MKKKVLIVIPSFSIGGTTSSLKALLSFMDKEEFDVDVFGRIARGPLKETLPNCKILGDNTWLSLKIVDGGLIKRICNFFLQNTRRLVRRIGLNLEPFYSRVGGKQLRTEDYDVVVSYQEDLTPIVCYYPAKRRVAWIHCEYSRFVSKQSRAKELDCLTRFDKIVCVSEFTKRSFCSFYPELEEKVTVVYNCLDVEHIREQAQSKELDDAFDHSGFTIVSAGRLDPVKQFERIPDIVANVLKEMPDAKLKWYIIGGGSESVKREILRRVAEKNLQDYVFILPFKNNVYPYIAASNLFVHTSSSETFSLVVNEAKAVGKPVLVNNYGCASEFVKDGVEGWIVPNAEMHHKIVELLSHPEELALVESYLRENQYDNHSIVELVKIVL